MYSVIVPVYNSQNTLTILAEGIITCLNKNSINFELILVDDDSEDQSRKIIQGIVEKHKGLVKALFLKQNYGQHLATACGIYLAKGDFVLTIDDDLQHAPSNLLRLISAQKERNAEVIYGCFKNKKKGNERIIYMFKRLLKVFIGKEVYISSLRLIEAHLAKKTLTHLSLNYLLDYYVSLFANKIEKIPLYKHKRLHGKSNYSFLTRCKLVRKGIILHQKLLLRMALFSLFLFGIVYSLILTLNANFEFNSKMYFLIIFVLILFLFNFDGLRNKLKVNKNSCPEELIKEIYR
jgi:glycosyltransferase involved in cell wall biosynthesis